MVLLSYFSKYGTWHMDGWTDVRTDSHVTIKIFEMRVTKFSKVWGSALAPLACRSSAV